LAPGPTFNRGGTRALLAQGLNVREAATRLKIGKTALYDALANAKSP
jgi:transposase